jgi:hypothetical protein
VRAQVGLATGIQGLAALAYCLATGALKTPPPSAFWGAAVASSCLNAVVKTLETKVGGMHTDWETERELAPIDDR